jgi:hypothetical protein
MFAKLAKVMERKDNKTFINVKTNWISMLAPAIRMMNKYQTLLVKL